MSYELIGTKYSIAFIDTMFAVSKKKGLGIQISRIQTLKPLWYWCNFLPIELISQPEAGHLVSLLYSSKNEDKISETFT